MNADDTPTPDDDAAERFAAAVEGPTADGGADLELARELAIARRLAAQGAALDPDPETRERARRRLLAALGQELPTNGPSRAS